MNFWRLKENDALKAEIKTRKNSTGTKSAITKSFWRSFSHRGFAILAVLSFTLLNIAYWSKSTVVDTDKFIAYYTAAH